MYFMVCSELNLASVPKNTWWVDYGATTNPMVDNGVVHRLMGLRE